ncbi:MAG: hypothetical protein ACM30I_02630 [Gemmatimonas sp.]
MSRADPIFLERAQILRRRARQARRLAAGMLGHAVARDLESFAAEMDDEAAMLEMRGGILGDTATVRGLLEDLRPRLPRLAPPKVG